VDTEWNQEYHRYREILKNLRLPLAFVDLDRFDENIIYVSSTQKHTGKKIRIASKSIRCLNLIKRIFDNGGDVYRGILAFTVEEAAFLIDHGFDNIIVAYPSIQPQDLDLMIEKTRSGSSLSLTVDSMEQLETLSRAGETGGVILSACLDIDMSYRPFGEVTHLGARRSPLRTVEQAVAIARHSLNLKGVRINSIMGYEGQIASVNDNLPGRGLKNRLVRFIKQRSIMELTERRKKIVKAVKSEGLVIEAVNGGGSGSLVSTGKDESVTEVTAGSAFFAPGLFRYFHDVKFRPSAFFALQVTRIPSEKIITCLGGGYVASGETAKNKLPVPVMPEGLKYLSLEGAGETQTPLILPGDNPDLKIGDPVIFQHAKAGELCERFNEIYLIKRDSVIDCVKTYRGEGKAFL